MNVIAGIIIVCAIVFALVVIGMMLYGAGQRQQKLEDLRAHGQRVVAKITKIDRQQHYRNNGTSYQLYTLMAEWTDPKTGQTRTFASDPLSSTKNYKVGLGVPILIDRTNPERYAMDL